MSRLAILESLEQAWELFAMDATLQLNCLPSEVPQGLRVRRLPMCGEQHRQKNRSEAIRGLRAEPHRPPPQSGCVARAAAYRQSRPPPQHQQTWLHRLLLVTTAPRL